jgi:hypothetical protein
VIQKNDRELDCLSNCFRPLIRPPRLDAICNKTIFVSVIAKACGTTDRINFNKSFQLLSVVDFFECPSSLFVLVIIMSCDLAVEILFISCSIR